jgi:hypothetical protein
MGLLEQGRFEEAWMHYEFRWDTADRVNDQRPIQSAALERREGQDPGHPWRAGPGRRDPVHVAVPKAQKRADRVIIECAERLVRTFSEGFGVPCYPNHAA